MHSAQNNTTRREAPTPFAAWPANSVSYLFKSVRVLFTIEVPRQPTAKNEDAATNTAINALMSIEGAKNPPYKANEIITKATPGQKNANKMIAAANSDSRPAPAIHWAENHPRMHVNPAKIAMQPLAKSNRSTMVTKNS